MDSHEIKKLRKHMAYTQQQFADALGVSFAAVNRWERGHNAPQPDRVRRIRELHAQHITKANIGSAVDGSSVAAPPQLDFEGDPEAVKLVVDAYRLRNGHLFNRAYGLELSRVVPLPHQRIAVYENLLPQAPLRFLLADDAGAGKTIMTGLYILEMLNRGRMKRVLICCPKGLVFNWQRELRFFFELNFTILKGSDFKDNDPVSDANLPFFIMSVDTAATVTVREKLAAKSGKSYDLVVFDEAHKLSWGDPNRSDSKTMRYRLAEALSQRTANMLLLTATPHMGREYPYFALWRLLDPAVFSTPDALRNLPSEKRGRHFIRRLKEEMVTYDGQPIYPPRLTQTVPVKLTPAELQFYEAATAYIQWSYENNRALNKNAAAMVVAVLQRRLASSTYAMMESLRRMREKREEIARKTPAAATQPDLDRLIVEIESTTADDIEPTEGGFESGEHLEEELVAAVRPKTAALLKKSSCESIPS